MHPQAEQLAQAYASEGDSLLDEIEDLVGRTSRLRPEHQP